MPMKTTRRSVPAYSAADDLRQLARAFCHGDTAAAAVRIAGVVGIALNVAHQIPALTGDAAWALPRGVTDFLVPFFVSGYSAARCRIAREQEDRR